MFSNKMFLVFCYIRLLKELSLITIIIFLISITLLIPNDFNVPTRKVSRHIELSNVSTHFDFRHDSDQKTKGKSESLKLRLAILS